MTQSPDSGLPESRKSRSRTRLRKSLMSGLSASPRLLRAIGRVGAGYMQMVSSTSRLQFVPEDALDRYLQHLPVIVTTWHGQHFFATTFWPIKRYPLATLISLKRDGEIMSGLAAGLGIRPIRGSGGRDPKMAVKSGAIRGFLQMKSALLGGSSVFMTADISRGVSRQAGEGIIRLARATGRPIMGIGVASAPELRLDNWDRSRIALPFGKTVCVVAPPFQVPMDADDALVEKRRAELEALLNGATEEAYAAIGRRNG